MNSINSIIDSIKHPIEDIKYINNCSALIKKNSLLVLVFLIRVLASRMNLNEIFDLAL